MVPRTRFRQIDVVLDAAQHFIADHALIAEFKDGAAFLLEPLVRAAFGQLLTPPYGPRVVPSSSAMIRMARIFDGRGALDF